MKVNCDYCLNEAELVGGDVLYPHRKDLYKKFFYRCLPCDAWVGTHPNSQKNIKPLGRLANHELREIKRKAHAIFDPLWKLKMMTRTEAYIWLAKAMDMDQRDCHIGMFDVATCKKVIDLVAKNMLGALERGTSEN